VSGRNVCGCPGNVKKEVAYNTLRKSTEAPPHRTRNPASNPISTDPQEFAKQKQKEMQLGEARIRRLKRQFTITSDLQTLSTLRNEQELLMKDRVAKYHRQQRAAEVLARRFDLLLQGKGKHSANITSYFLGTERV